MYQNNPDGITWRVKQVLARAIASVEAAPALPEVSPKEIRSRIKTCLNNLGNSPKVGKIRDVFKIYATGASLDEVIRKTDLSRGTVSNYLNLLERETGLTIIRGNRRAPQTGALQGERQNGKRRASIHDFHSFRVTWITLALAAGVPLELVQRVTGHRTVQVVMKHYFRPGREDFRQVVEKAMPKMLGESQTSSAKASPKDQIQRVLERMTFETWERDRDRLLSLLGTL